MNSTNLDEALRIRNAGASILPCWPDSKNPAIKEWTSRQRHLPTEQQVREEFGLNGRALAVVCGAVSGNREGIDIDNKPQPGYPDANTLFHAMRELVEAEDPELWDSLVIESTPSSGYHLIYRCDTVQGNQKLALRPATDDERQQANNPKLDRVTLIETRGEGGYLVSAPSPGYKVIQGDLAEPPVITPAQRACLFNVARSLNLFIPEHQIVGRVVGGDTGKQPGTDYNERTTADDVVQMLEQAGWEAVRTCGTTIYMRRPGKKDGWSATVGHGDTNLLYVFTTNAGAFEPGTAYKPFAVYTLLAHDGDFKAAARALAAQGYGAQRPGTAQARNAPSRQMQGDVQVQTGDDVRDAPLTDAGNAECMALLYCDTFRYCHTRSKWLHWLGNCWQLDSDGGAQRAALHVARARQAAAINIEDVERKRKAIGWGISSESTTRRTAMLQTAAILETFATTVDMYDRDPLLAAVENGTLDLRTNRLRASMRDDYITLQCGTAYDATADCPRFKQFLHEVTGGDDELIAYLQRAVGYSLTGDTSEQKLFLCLGSGVNGKSVLLEVLRLLLGDYAANASFETFDAGRRNEATNDLAALKGKRLVTVIETEEDRRLAEARVKAVTGGDVVTCRFLYGEFFSYRPQFKIWMAMNYKPIIRGADRGIWRRIQLIPFEQNFEGRADPHLIDTLIAELPGILNWALEGLAAWQAHGLGTCAAVSGATEAYRRESDFIGQWLEERTVPDAAGVLTVSAALQSVQGWCMEYGYHAPNERALGRRLGEEGYERKQIGKQRTRCYVGIRLREDDEPAPQGERKERSEQYLGKPFLKKSSSREVPENSVHVVRFVHPIQDEPPMSVYDHDIARANGGAPTNGHALATNAAPPISDLRVVGGQRARNMARLASQRNGHGPAPVQGGDLEEELATIAAASEDLV